MAAGAVLLILRSSARGRASRGSLSHYPYVSSSVENKCVERPDLSPIDVTPMDERKALEALLLGIMVIFIIISLFLIF